MAKTAKNQSEKISRDAIAKLCKSNPSIRGVAVVIDYRMEGNDKLENTFAYFGDAEGAPSPGDLLPVRGLMTQTNKLNQLLNATMDQTLKESNAATLLKDQRSESRKFSTAIQEFQSGDKPKKKTTKTSKSNKSSGTTKTAGSAK